MDRKTKVFIVEDQVSTSMALADNLTTLGYNVVGIAKSAEKAIELVEKELPDIIFMDVYLEGKMTGIGATEIIYNKFQIPVIILTASANDQVFEKVKMEGIYGFIIKPFEPKDLKITIEIALYKHDIKQKIKKDKYLLDTAQRIAHVGHWDLNLITEELKWSDETYRIFEINPQKYSASYEAFISLIHPEDRELVNKAYTDSLISKTPYEIEHRLLFKDGRIKYIKENGISFYDANNKPISSLGTVQDITTTKTYQIALKKSEEDLEEAQNIAKLGYYDFDIKNDNWTSSKVLDDIFNINQQFKKTFSSWIQFLHPDFKEEMLDYFTNKVLTNKEEFNKEYKIITTKTGKEKWVHGRGKLKFDANKNPIRLFGTIQDITERKIAEEKIKQSEEKYRMLIDCMHDGIMKTDNNDVIQFVNEKFCKQLGYSEKELIGKTARDLLIFDKKDKKIVNEKINQRKNKIGDTYELLFKKKNGKKIWFLISGSPTYDGNGKVNGSMGIHTDITKRKLIEEELRLSEEKFRTYVENSADVITIANENLEILYNSPNNIFVFGYDQNENIGANIIEFIHPDDLDEFINLFNKKNTKQSFQYRYKHKTEGWIWIDSSTKHVDNKKQAPYFIFNSRDISDKKEIENNLIDSELRYRSLFENNMSGVYRIDLDDKIIEANDAFANIIGFASKNQIIGKQTKEIYEREKEKESFNLLKIKGGQLKSFLNFIVLKKNAKRVRLLENVSIIKNSKGEPLYYEGSVIDTTLILELEAEKRSFELIPAENPNPVIRISYDFKILYANMPGKYLLLQIATKNYLTNKEIIKSIDDILKKKLKHGNVEIRSDNKVFVLYISNIEQYEYVNIYAADISELKQTQTNYLQLNMALEQLVEERTKDLNNAVTVLKAAEKEANKSLIEKEILLNEITHRVKNNLQVVASLLSLQKDTITNEESLQLLSNTAHRIKSMALIHETLYKSHNFSEINMKTYLESLIRYILNSFDASFVDINYEIEEIDLTIDTATSCGMIVMELITNSLKYAFEEKKEGNINLILNQIDEQNYKLIISDNGKGFPKGLDYTTTKTLGMQLVNGLTAQLQGSINKIPSKGTSFEIIFKDTKRHKHEKN